MGVKDGAAKKYFKDNRRFADLFNYHLFNGMEVIKPDFLQEMDPVETTLNTEGFEKRWVKTERISDLKRLAVIKTYKQTVYVLLGLENESEVRYDLIFDTS